MCRYYRYLLLGLSFFVVATPCIAPGATPAAMDCTERGDCRRGEKRESFHVCRRPGGEVTGSFCGDEGDGGAVLTLQNGLGQETLKLDGSGTDGAGRLVVRNATGASVAELVGSNVQSVLYMFRPGGKEGVRLESAGSGPPDKNGGFVGLTNANDPQTFSVFILGQGTNSGGEITLTDAAGTQKLFLIGDDGTGKSRVAADCVSSGGCDVAEGFDVSNREAIKPGVVVVIDALNPGKLTLSTQAYDKKVAGIISGANGLEPGVTLGQRVDNTDGPPVALSGRVYCFVDATEHAVEVGDLLTTSNTPGHAMKVTDFARSQGAVLGKAMEPLEKGKKGLILALVALQ